MSPPPRRFPLPLNRVGRGAPNTQDQPAKTRSGTAQSGSRVAAPTGLGLDSTAVRARMVQRLRAEGAGCDAVLTALGTVPRHQFVESGLAPQAYEDTALPIGWGQTISKPSVIARMLALLFDGRESAHSGSLGRVLEIGTGCGYQAALLTLLSQQVISIERLRPLYERARENLAPIRSNKLRLVYGDGRLGHAPNAPYDAIICAAGGDDVPTAWLEQMAVGGRLIAPTRAEVGPGQVLLVIDRHADGWTRRSHEAVRFVPLRSGTA
ncbi:MAG: protein-L-isoaspartate(D-aspartate) O-methyltransferase [Pseudomonadota bacterium]